MYKPKSIEITNIISHRHTMYEFKEGKAVIVIGDNQDDPSQKGNGAGKSGLIESIAIAMNGAPLRDCKQKELLYNETGSGEITFILWNTMLSRELKIIRKLFETKAQQVELWIEGKQKVCSDVNEYNRAIFNEIGITKEDFFKFYLITKDEYEPFLKIGDTKKKVIINRFSGADSVDAVEPYIKEDVEAQRIKVQVKDSDLLVNKTRQEALAEQIKLEEERNSNETRTKLLEIKQGQFNLLTQELVLKEQDCKQKEIIAGEKGFEVATFIFREKYDELRGFIATDIKQVEIAIEKHKTDLGNIVVDFTDQINETVSTLKDTRLEVSSTQRLIKEGNELYNEIFNQLQGVIACPKCGHKFNLQDKDFVYEESEMLIKEIQETLDTLKETIIELSEIETSLVEAKADIDKQVEEKQSQIRQLIQQALGQVTQYRLDIQEMDKMETEDKLALASLKLTHDQLTDQTNKIKREIVSAKEEIDLLKGDINRLNNTDCDDKYIKILTTQLQELMKIHEALMQEKFTEQTKLEDIEVWLINFKNFKSFLANKSIRNIKDYTNLFLESMGSNIRIEMEGYKVLSNKKIKEEITITVERDGLSEGSYGKFSGGERGRIDVCNILAIQELINLNAPNGGLDLLLCDEIFDSIDSKGLECIINGLQSLGKTIMIVSQVEINSLKEYTVVIRKQNKVSTIVL